MKIRIKVGQISYPYQYLPKKILLEIRKATLLTFDWFWPNLITLSTLRRYQALRPLPTVHVRLVLYKVWHIFPTILDFSYFSQPGLTLQRLGGKKEQSFYIYNLLLSKIPKMILRLLSCLLHSATLYKLKKIGLNQEFHQKK